MGDSLRGEMNDKTFHRSLFVIPFIFAISNFQLYIKKEQPQTVKVGGYLLFSIAWF